MKRRVGLLASLIIGVFFILIAAPHAAHGAIAVDNVSTGTTDRGSTITISHETSGSDRLMLVGVSFNNDSYETVAGITYNGVPLSFVGEDHRDDDARVEIWMLVGPDLGTHDVKVTFNRALYRQAIAGVVTFTGVDQNGPLRTFASEYGDGSTASVGVPSATGELVFGIVAAEWPSGLTAGSGQTERWNLSMGGGRTGGAGSTEPGASTVTTSWTLGSSDHWAVAGISVKPSSGATPLSVSITSPTSGPTYSTTGGVISLGGTAGDDVGVVEVTWSNDRGGSGTCSGTTSWTVENITLAEGSNVITVTARDADGNTVTDTLTVNYTPDSGSGSSSTTTGDAPGDTVLFRVPFEPNVLIIFDTSSSMNEILWLDGYDRNIDYEGQLGPQGKAVVFSSDHAISKNFVTYDTASSRVQLNYLRCDSS
ncbi:MAG: hypothetical protein JRJ26_14260, partial [Deltaproteobacteria bacterium]|nr:hypothetical protein [Deltaproteobacteria bacterium]